LVRLLRIGLFALLFCACAGRREVPRLEQWETTRTNGAAHVVTRLPATPYAHLVMRAYVDEMTVSIDGRPVYHFRDPGLAGQLTFHIVPLPPGSAGKSIDVYAPRAPSGPIIGESPYLANEGSLPLALDGATIDRLREDADAILLGIVLFVTGVIACAASAIRRRGDVLALRSFGAFTLLYGVRLLTQSSLPLFFGAPWQTMAFVTSFITYVIPIAGWLLPLRLIGDGWKSTLRWQVWAFALFAPIGIVSDIVTGTPSSLETANNILVVIGGMNILFNLLRRRGARELHVVLAGTVVFLLFTFNNNLVALAVLPWRFQAEAPGFVFFVATLGYAATRAFLRGERARLAIESELDAAREIQQSLLPRSMPEVTGLRFHVGYDPATSVAGDVYDFLRVDDRRTGVLVADVAGHGVPAALIGSMVKVVASSQARLADDPAALLAELNGILRREVRRAFVTATYLWFDMERSRVAVCNAGHPAPLLCRGGAFRELGEPGMLLGRFGDARYVATFTDLAPGDRIVAYTDGIVEARDARGELFGEARLQDVVRGGDAEAVLAAVHAWRGDANADADDLTIVIVDVT
jgi:sigma-B regulation protein RsbU (phosphoserine phosphatase)